MAENDHRVSRSAEKYAEYSPKDPSVTKAGKNVTRDATIRPEEAQITQHRHSLK